MHHGVEQHSRHQRHKDPSWWWWPARRLKGKRLRFRELLFIVLVVRSLWYGVFSEEYLNDIENLFQSINGESDSSKVVNKK